MQLHAAMNLSVTRLFNIILQHKQTLSCCSTLLLKGSYRSYSRTMGSGETGNKTLRQSWKTFNRHCTRRSPTLATVLQTCQLSTCGWSYSSSNSLRLKAMPEEQAQGMISPLRVEILHVPEQWLQQVRRKSRKKSVQSDSDSDSDEDDGLAADDFDAPAKFKVMKIYTASMRSDAIISNALGVARNRLEEMFYGPGMLLNGAKMMKKSIKMEEGDYVDLVVDRMEDQLKVKRVKVMKIYSGKTNTDKLNIKVRVWKAPFLVKDPNNDRRSS